MTFLESKSPFPPVDLPGAALEIVARIERLNEGLAAFWSESAGWAPVSAAGLLSKSRLDWQVSLSTTLRLWIRENPAELTPGELILAWTNLGSLIEGTLKTLLSVYYEDYLADLEALKKANAYDHKREAAKEPDGLTLDQIRKFCAVKELLSAQGNALVALVQQRRNAIHAFQDKPIGDGSEFLEAVRAYLDLLRSVNDLLPYPDYLSRPREA